MHKTDRCTAQIYLRRDIWPFCNGRNAHVPQTEAVKQRGACRAGGLRQHDGSRSQKAYRADLSAPGHMAVLQWAEDSHSAMGGTKRKGTRTMIKSMTGFGRCEHQQGSRKFTVEMKAVNHRYFDVNIKMPKKFSFFEAAMRGVLKTYVQRGKLDVFVTYEDFAEENVALKYNESIAAEYLTHFKEMAERFSLENDITVSVLGRCPEVFTMEEQDIDEQEIWAVLEQALTGACRQFVEAREAEGEALKTDILDKLERMDENVTLVEQRYPQIIAEYRAKLEDKVHELLADSQIDESRLASEVVLFADKICTDEETVRLRSHIRTMQEALKQGGAVGRKLDFIAQEMNREANTILSKANDLETSNLAIELKTEIEKVREQIQNIE